jgi:hypothetical protein
MSKFCGYKVNTVLGNGESKKYGLVDSGFDKSRVPSNKCPICGNTSISTFPILPNEEFTFFRGVELEFGLKKSNDRAKGK